MKKKLIYTTALFFLSACHYPPQTVPQTVPTGTIQFFINWPQTLRVQKIPDSAMRLKVSVTSNGLPISKTVTVERPKTTVTLDGIAVGDNRVVEADALDSSNQIVAQGKSKPVSILENATTPVAVTLTPTPVAPPKDPEFPSEPEPTPAVPEPTPHDDGPSDDVTVVEPQPGKLSGGVRNTTTGQPIGGATVRVTGPTTAQATTIFTGEYSTNTLPPGTYTATASAPNYKSQTKTITIDGDTPQQNFDLTPDVVIPPSPTINVTSPSSGQTLTKGTNYSVTWSSSNVSGNVKVKVFKGNSDYGPLGADEPNDSQLDFNPPFNWPDGNDYRIQVMDLNSTVANFSPYFTLQSPALVPPPPPSLNSPASGNTASPGNITFSWGTVATAGRYHLMVCPDSTLNSGCVNPDGAMVGVEPESNTSATVNLTAGTWYWAVRSICPGDACTWGSYSSTRLLTVQQAQQTYNPTVSITSSANASVPVVRRGTGHYFTQNGSGLPPNSTVTYRFQYPNGSITPLDKTTNGSGFVSNSWTPNSSAAIGPYYLSIRYTANSQTLDTPWVSYRVDP